MSSNRTIKTRRPNNPEDWKVIPDAISSNDLDMYGCPKCGHSKGHVGTDKLGMPLVAEGTYVWVCLGCGGYSHILAPGINVSAIPFGGYEDDEIEIEPFYPSLCPHPRRKMGKGKGEGE